MKKKIIVMGLGGLFRRYEKQIYEKFEVLGVTSNKETEAELFSNYITLANINNYDYDYILICSISEVEIVNQLIGERIAEPGKILLASVIFDQKGIFHSQYNEDAVLVLLLELIDLNYKDITYLDVGANHPVKLNNTYALYLLGASGVLVEPNKNLKNIIEIVRPRDTLINKAVSLDGEPAVFFDLNASELGTLAYEKLDQEYCKQFDNFELKETYTVETVSINDLFCSIGRIPDVISIDIEGYDYTVLKQIDYENCRPAIIIVEIAAWGVKEQEGDQFKNLLYENDYLLFCANDVNAVFVDKKYEHKIKAYMQWR